MKFSSGPLFDALKDKATRLVYGFLIVRTDGARFGFTSGDTAFVYGGDTYTPANGLMGSATTSKNNLSVDNMTVTSLLTDQISEDDLRSGLFDNAQVKVFWIDALNPQWGAIPLRGGRFGEVTVKNSQYEVELRALMQLLQQPYGRFFNLNCDASVGDNRCKLDLVGQPWLPHHSYIASAPGDAGIGSTVKPSTFNGCWYVCTGAIQGSTDSPASSVANTAYVSTFAQDLNSTTNQQDMSDQLFVALGGDGGGANSGGAFVTGGPGGFNGSFVETETVEEGTAQNSALYLTPTKQYAAPATAPAGTEPLSITNGFATIVYTRGNSGATEPAWPATVGNTIVDGDLTWTAVRARTVDFAITQVFTNGQFAVVAVPMMFPIAYFNYGTVKFTSGDNANRIMEVRGFDYTPEANFFLLEQMPFPVQIGDTFVATVGCARNRPACLSFNNMNNYRGFPDMPTEDKALTTPNFTQQGTQADPSSGS